MDENRSKSFKVKETEKLKNIQEDSTINSPTRLTEINVLPDTGKNEENTVVHKDIFKFKDHYLDKGNILMYLFDKNGIPKIVIGPHCKTNNILFYFIHREINYIFIIIIKLLFWNSVWE